MTTEAYTMTDSQTADYSHAAAISMVIRQGHADSFH